MAPTVERDVFLGFGSNLGDRSSVLARTIETIRGWAEVREVEASPCYESEYVGPFGPQDPYLNQCARVRTTLSAAELLARTQELERAAGRAPHGHQRPRVLDIDLLLDGDRVVSLESLCLPHPRLRERRFVLQPLADLDPSLRLPPDGAAVRDLLADATVRAQSLRRWEVPA